MLFSGSKQQLYTYLGNCVLGTGRISQGGQGFYYNLKALNETLSSHRDLAWTSVIPYLTSSADSLAISLYSHACSFWLLTHVYVGYLCDSQMGVPFSEGLITVIRFGT